MIDPSPLNPISNIETEVSKQNEYSPKNSEKSFSEADKCIVGQSERSVELAPELLSEG
jgi:hypothetical protein